MSSASFKFSSADAVGQHVRITLLTEMTHQGYIYAYEPTLGMLALQCTTTTTSTTTTSNNANVTGLPNQTQQQQQQQQVAGDVGGKRLEVGKKGRDLYSFALVKVSAVKNVQRIPCPTPPTSATTTTATTSTTTTSTSLPQPPSKSWADDVDDDDVGVLSSSTLSTPSTLANETTTTKAKPGILVAVKKVDEAVIRAREEANVRAEIEAAGKIGVGVSELAQDIFYALDKTLPTRWKNQTITVLDNVFINPPYTREDVVGANPKAVERVKMVLDMERRRLLKGKEES